jgi:hypothetical protein
MLINILPDTALKKHVVTQCVEASLVAELFVEVHGENRDVHRHQPARVISHHQRGSVRQPIEPPSLRSKPPLRHWLDHPDDALEEAGIPFGQFAVCEEARHAGVTTRSGGVTMTGAPVALKSLRTATPALTASGK